MTDLPPPRRRQLGAGNKSTVRSFEVRRDLTAAARAFPETAPVVEALRGVLTAERLVRRRRHALERLLEDR